MKVILNKDDEQFCILFVRDARQRDSNHGIYSDSRELFQLIKKARDNERNSFSYDGRIFEIAEVTFFLECITPPAEQSPYSRPIESLVTELNGMKEKEKRLEEKWKSELENCRVDLENSKERKKEAYQEIIGKAMMGSLITKIWKNSRGDIAARLDNGKTYNLNVFRNNGSYENGLLAKAKKCMDMDACVAEAEKRYSQIQDCSWKKNNDSDRNTLIDAIAYRVFERDVTDRIAKKAYSSGQMFHCWRCKHRYGRDYTPVCPICKWNVCPNCGACNMSGCQNLRTQKLKNGEIRYRNGKPEESVLLVGDLALPVSVNEEANSYLQKAIEGLSGYGIDSEYLPLICQGIKNKAKNKIKMIKTKYY